MVSLLDRKGRYMFVDGIGLSGYRSFGDSLQRIGPCAKVNLLIGQNNSGKSNVLLFLNHHLQPVWNSTRRAANLSNFNSIDRPLGVTSGRIGTEFALRLGGNTHEAVVENLARRGRWDRHAEGRADKILRSQTLSQGSEVAWFRYETPWEGTLVLASDVVDEIHSEGVLPDDEWRAFWTALTNQNGGSVKEQWIPQTLHNLSPVQAPETAVEMIPAIRRVGDRGSEPTDFSGIGLIDRLARLQNPGFEEQTLRDRFQEINGFVRTVTRNSTATLEIPYGRDTILVHMDGKTLPLSSLGTGIHEVVIIAAAATMITEQIVCIEEPELHLHASLQRELVKYLEEKTNNQYFISTHSAHLIDAPGAAIFDVRLHGGQSHVEAVQTDDDRFEICTDLGYRASDLTQANCVIWVEGPTDRIYLNHWLQGLDSSLVEGLHYSVMFYGGRLLSHLTANDPDVGDFISLRRLNRNIAIVIDSDRDKAGKRLNLTKQRVRKEFDQGSGFAWITQGREIENYLESVPLESAVKQIYSDAARLMRSGQYGRPLRYKTAHGATKDVPDKVKVARQVAMDSPPNLDVLDLRAMVNKLADFIRASNDPTTT